MTDAIVARIMRIRNGMTTDEDAEAIIEREIAALQHHERSSPDSETELAEKISLHMQLGDSGPGFHLTDVDLRMIVKALKRRPAQSSAANDSVWTPQKFWEYVEGLTDSLVRDQIRDMLASTGLTITSVAQGPDYKACFFDTLKMLHEAIDVIEAIDSECLLPPQLQDLVDAALVHRTAYSLPSTERGGK